MKKEELELQRNNVTPAQFLAYVRSQIKKHGIKNIDPADIDLAYFAAGNDLNFPLHTHDGITEMSVSRPYEMQTYVKHADGCLFNMIMEFTFDTEKTGSGYFYYINVWKEEGEEMEKKNLYEIITEELENEKPRSAWGRGVKDYAFDILEHVWDYIEYTGKEPETETALIDIMLNGAYDWQKARPQLFDNWAVASWGGSYLCYDVDIAGRLCTPSELKKTNYGEKQPNPREQWLDVQARALFQAGNLILHIFRRIKSESAA